MVIPAIDMKNGQTARIVDWAGDTDRLRGLEVQRVGDALFLAQASWQDAFSTKSFLLCEDDYRVELLA